MERWIAFYLPFFADHAHTETWVARCEAQAPPNIRAKIMMHQAQRLVSIADDLPAIRRTAESLQVMFLLSCAENISKLHDNIADDGQSRAYVQRFFRLFVVGNDRDVLEHAFTDHDDRLLRPEPFECAVSLLYGVRCDVVHEGNFWGFAFHDGTTPMVNVDPDVIANIRLIDLRNVIVRGCINAITECLNAP
jgi:hypothetical protein